MAFPEDAMPMRIRIAPAADLTDMPDTYPWQDITGDVSFSQSSPIAITVGQTDEQQEGQSATELRLRNHESRVIDENGDPWVTGATPGAAGRYTTDNPTSDLWPGWALGCPVEISCDPLGDGWSVRSIQYANTITDTWPGTNATDNLVITEVQLAGLLVRCQAKKDARSALYRTLFPVNAANALTVHGSTFRYWPMEQASIGTTLQRSWPSAFTGYPEAQSRPALGGAIDGPVGSLATPLFVYPASEGQTGLDIQWELPDSSTGSGLGNQWSIGWTFRGVLGDTPHSVMRRFNVYLRGPGTWAAAVSGSSYLTDVSVLIYAHHDGTGFVVGSGSTGIDFSPPLSGTIGITSFTNYPYLNLWDGEAHGIQLTMQQALVGVVTTLYVDGVIVGTSGPVAGTLTHPFRVECRGSGGTLGSTTVDNGGSSIGVGHFYYAPGIGVLESSWAAVGYPGEKAHTRIERLSAEEGVPCTVHADDSVEMGPQLVAAYVPLIRECEKTDRGIIDDSLGFVDYTSISELYNQTAAITLTGPLGQIYQPIAPVTDDSRVRNDVTATRQGGLPQRVSDEPHAVKVGRYTDGPTVSVETDAGARAQAGWAVHIGTHGDGNAKRYPAVNLRLHLSPEVISDWLDQRPGFVLRRTGLPLAHAPGPVDGLVRGWTEVFSHRRKWEVSMNTVPYAPYEVFQIQNAAGAGHYSRGRLDCGRDTAGTETPPGLSDTRLVVSALDSDDLSLLMLNRGRPFDWTTDGADFPLDLELGGEQVTVSAIADKWLDAFGRTSAAGSWGSADTGSAYTLVGTAANFSVGSGVGSIVCGASASDRIAYQTGLGIGGDQIARVDIRASSGSALPLNSSGYLAGLVMRRDSVTGDHYRITLFVNSTTGALNVRASRNVGGVVTVLTTTALPWTFATNTWYRLVGYVVGDSIKAKLYPRDDGAGVAVHPGWPVWQLETTNTTIPASATTDRIGILGRVDDGSTTHTWQYDNARLLSPQLVTISDRSVNEVVKSHAIGTGVRLWRPAAYALAGRP